MGDQQGLQTLAAAVVDGGLPVSIAALHGAACGFAVFDDAEFPLYELADLLDPGLSGDDPALVEFVEAVREALGSEDFGFALLLPDEDDAEPEERLEALGLWCGSFLQAFGAGLARLPEASGTGFTLPDELQEIVDDLAAIAEVDPETAADDDAGDVEGQLLELEEFVKVGVLLIASVMSHGVADQDE